MVEQHTDSTLAEQSGCPNCGATHINVLARETVGGRVSLDNGDGFAEYHTDEHYETTIVAANCAECDTVLIEDEEWVYEG